MYLVTTINSLSTARVNKISYSIFKPTGIQTQIRSWQQVYYKAYTYHYMYHFVQLLQSRSTALGHTAGGWEQAPTEGSHDGRQENSL